MLAVGHPCGVVREDAGNLARGFAGGGDDPEGLLGCGGEVIAEQETGAVGGDVAERRSGELVGKGQGAGFAVGDEGLGENAAAIFNLREVDA